MIRVLRCAAAVLLALVVVSCGTTVPPSPPPDTTELTVSIPIQTTDKAVIEAAVEVMSTRLRALGVGTFTSSAGSNLTFTISLDGTVDKAAIDAVLRTSGVVSFLGWTTSDPPSEGGPAPTGVPSLFDAAGQIVAASVVGTPEAPSIEITLAAGGAGALGTYTSAHVGDTIVVVLDGRVLWSAVVMAGIAGGRVDLSFPRSPPIPPEAIAAVMASGPLPAGWIAP